MKPIEEIKCESGIQAIIREEFYRKECIANLNTNSCYISRDDEKECKKYTVK